MKVQVFNDTQRTWILHPAMEQVKHDGHTYLPPRGTLTVETDAQTVLIKLWEDGTVLVQEREDTA